MYCCDPATRAATLLRVPGQATLCTPAGVRETAAVATPWGAAVLLLLPPGGFADEVRSGTEAVLEVVQRTATWSGTAEHGRLDLIGRVHAAPPAGRRQIALQLWEAHPDEHLLDAVADDGWLLAFLDVKESCWTLDRGTFPIPVAQLLSAKPDPVLQQSLLLCRHLNEDHPGLARWLAGQTACFSEVDGDGATLITADQGVMRVPWPTRCDSLRELHDVLGGLPADIRR